MTSSTPNTTLSVGLKPGQEAFDPATQRAGIVAAIYPARDLLFEYRVRGEFVAFLRPVGGGPEWWADPSTLQWPPMRIDLRSCVFCGVLTDRDRVMVGVVGGDPAHGWTGYACRFCVGERDLAPLDLGQVIDLVSSSSPSSAAIAASETNAA
jgi:hypothetical protein